MSFPSIALEWSPTTNPGTSPSWVDITTYLRAASCHMGRQYELDRFEAGGGDLILDNRDRTFDPKYNSNVLPMRRFRLRATWSGTTYPVFHQFASGFPQEWPGTGKDALVRLKLVDGFKVLNLAKLNTSYVSQRSDVRIGAVLDSASWPAADRVLRTGQSTMQASTLTNSNALQHCQDVESSENGRFWMDSQCRACFDDRHAPWVVAAQTTSQATFGDGGGSELPYAVLTPSYDDALIYNEVRVTRSGGVEQVATDATSQATYLTRTLAKSGLLVTTDGEMSDAANYLLAKYKDPWYRFVTMELAPTGNDSLWAQALGRGIGDRITVTRRPPGGGTITQDAWVQGIRHEIAGKSWRTTWQLVPADLVNYWQLNDPVLGILGSTTRLGY